MCGSCLFPYATGNHVHVRLLHFFQDLEEINSYAWGVVVLAYLYNGLDQFLVNKISTLVGCVPLIQVILFKSNESTII